MTLDVFIVIVRLIFVTKGQCCGKYRKDSGKTERLGQCVAPE